MDIPVTDAFAEAMTLIDTTRSIPAVLIGDPRFLADARDSLDVVGARVASEFDWHEVGESISPPSLRALIVIETRGAGDDVLAGALPRIAAAADMRDSPIVVSLATSEIDTVAAAVLGPRTQMLCEPSATDRTLAISLAAQLFDDSQLRDTAYEGEAARLERLNEEVARIADVLARLSRREASDRPRRVPERINRDLFHVEPMPDIAIDAGEIRRAIRGRRLRDQFFGAGLFEEPGWDMMLDLFAAELEQARVSVSSLCIAAAVAPTTALRWISKLTEAGLFERQPDPFDRRRAYMELSERASRAMREYIGALRRAGLSLA